MRRIGLLLLGIGLAGVVCGAEPPVPGDFASGLRLQPQGDHALWELELPEQVYRTVTRSDLGDIRVFNRAGDAVPFTLRRPVVTDVQAPEPERVPVFALRAEPDSDESGRSVRIVTDERGSIVDVLTPETDAAGERIGAYLIDASKVEGAPAALELAWARPDGEGFVTTVQVEASDDLAHWRTLAVNATLADLQSGDHALVHRRIPLPGVKVKYLRLSWPDDLAGVRVSAATLTFASTQRPLPRRWREVVAARVPDQPGVFEFDAEGHWPADRIRVGFPAGNIVTYARLLSRPSAADRWRVRTRGVFYDLRQNDVRLRSDPVQLQPTTDRYWRLDTSGGEGVARSGMPVLEQGWVPHVLTFVAQGDAPFTVAFGSATAGAARQPVDGLLRHVGQARQRALVGQARIQERVVLGGKARLTPPPAPLPWKKWLLWAVLVLGVLALAAMVRRTYQQMSTESDSED